MFVLYVYLQCHFLLFCISMFIDIYIIYIFICDVWSFDIAGDTIIVFLNVLTMQICEVFFIYTVLYRVLVTQMMDNRCTFVWNCDMFSCMARRAGMLLHAR